MYSKSGSLDVVVFLPFYMGLHRFACSMSGGLSLVYDPSVLADYIVHFSLVPVTSILHTKQTKRVICHSGDVGLCHRTSSDMGRYGSSQQTVNFPPVVYKHLIHVVGYKVVPPGSLTYPGLSYLLIPL